jgi:hypothetical protein
LGILFCDQAAASVLLLGREPFHGCGRTKLAGICFKPSRCVHRLFSLVELSPFAGSLISGSPQDYSPGISTFMTKGTH